MNSRTSVHTLLLIVTLTFAVDQDGEVDDAIDTNVSADPADARRLLGATTGT